MCTVVYDGKIKYFDNITLAMRLVLTLNMPWTLIREHTDGTVQIIRHKR